MLDESLKLLDRMDRISENNTKFVNEISKNEKNRIRKKAINAIDNKEDNIRTFLIITGENPMGEPGTNNINRTQNNSLVDYLKQGHYAWQPVQGKYGSTENSKIIFNVPLDESKMLALKFGQQSFIYGRKENGKTLFDLYYINEQEDDYDLVETQDTYDKVLGDDYYTKIDKKHKFSVPFEYFNESCENFNKIINEQKKKSDKYNKNFDRFLNESIKENKIGYNRYLNRCLIYGSLFK